LIQIATISPITFLSAAGQPAEQRHHCSRIHLLLFPLDTREATIPKTAAPLTFDAYRKGRHAALAAITN
jgi:hypothetical protein